MNYYPFHLGDYSAHTAHLEPMEDLAYRRMLDLYYRTELPLPTDWRDIARLIRLKDQGPAIEAVLSEFFTLTDAGWFSVRCAAEIAKMQDKQAKARASGIASANTRSTNAQRPLNERSTDAQLPTPTPTPTPTPNKVKNTTPTKKEPGKPKAEAIDPHAILADVEFSVVEDWLKVRKEKKARALTQTAVDAIRKQAALAGMSMQDALTKCCARNWVGFEAAWVRDGNGQGAPPTAYQQMQIEKHEERKRFSESMRRSRNEPTNRTPIDITPERVD